MLPDAEGEPHFHLAVVNEKTVLVGMNERSMKDALGRVGGPKEKLSDKVQMVMKGMPTNSQVRMAFVLPAEMKKMLAQVADMGAAMNQGGPGGPGGGPGGWLQISMLGVSQVVRVQGGRR